MLEGVDMGERPTPTKAWRATQTPAVETFLWLYREIGPTGSVKRLVYLIISRLQLLLCHDLIVQWVDVEAVMHSVGGVMPRETIYSLERSDSNPTGLGLASSTTQCPQLPQFS